MLRLGVHPTMQNQLAMYHILYRIPHNVALVRADRRTDGRTDRRGRQTDFDMKLIYHFSKENNGYKLEAALALLLNMRH